MSNVPDLTGDGPFRDPDEEILSAELVDDDGEMSGRDNPFSALSAGGLGGGLDLGAMMQMAQDMGSQMAAAQEELAADRDRGHGGRRRGVGHPQRRAANRSVSRIDPAAFDPDDPSMLEDLVVAGVDGRVEQVEATSVRGEPARRTR